MIHARKSDARGKANHGWLKSRHTFSFADYHDPRFNGFSVLRVINEDRIDGGAGFDAHPHRDMEIISYVIDGAVEHRDSMGTDTVIKPGEVQRMTAGTGVRHSEFNHYKDKITHFLQIWILPGKTNEVPGYDQKSFTAAYAGNGLVLVGSRDGREGSLTIHQDVDLYACQSSEAGATTLAALAKRNVWVQVIKGAVQVEGETLVAGDGAAIQAVDALPLAWGAGSEFIVFDLP